MEKPKRAVQFSLELEADTIEELENTLYNILIRMERGELSSTGVSGGVSSGYSYELISNDRPTHKEYVQQLNTYLDYLNPTKE